jgi:hypothetical protein
MMLSRLMAPLAAVTITLAASASITGAAALPLPGPGARPTADAGLPIELAHGCHRGIQRDYAGWHFHNRACVKQPTSPPGLRDIPAYRRFYRGPVCAYRCHNVGPVKTCQQVCR